MPAAKNCRVQIVRPKRRYGKSVVILDTYTGSDQIHGKLMKND